MRLDALPVLPLVTGATAFEWGFVASLIVLPSALLIRLAADRIKPEFRRPMRILAGSALLVVGAFFLFWGAWTVLWLAGSGDQDRDSPATVFITIAVLLLLFGLVLVYQGWFVLRRKSRFAKR